VDGLFELLFIAVFILAAIFDAVARSRGKRRRMEEMEAEEEAAHGMGLPSGDTATPQGSRESSREAARARREERREARRREWEQRREEAEARRDAAEAERRGRDVGREVGSAAGSGAGAEAGAGERETADAMVPDDLWAILTGQPRAPRTPESSPREAQGEAPREARGSGDRGKEPPSQVGAGTPPPLSRPGPGPSSPSPETRRSSRWMEGVGGRGDSDRWSRGATQPEERIGAEERRAYDLPPSPWGTMEDISAGEISDGGGRVQTAGPDQDEPRGRGRRPSVHAGAYAKGGAGAEGAGRYARLLTSANLEDLRTAIVLREVLGTPVGFRDRAGEGEIW
jgi:hypothetical protein